MCREGFQTGFLAGVIREACLAEQETLESAVKFLPRPRQRGRSLLDHWLRPIPAKMAPFITGADTPEQCDSLFGFQDRNMRTWQCVRCYGNLGSRLRRRNLYAMLLQEPPIKN